MAEYNFYELQRYAKSLLSACKPRMLATAESCTGGMLAASLTDIAGSSAVFDRGFVTYSNEAKTELLGVPTELIARYGAVSAEVAGAMAEGTLARSNAAIAITTTGIAGPGGGSPEKPVGLVWFGLARTGSPTVTVRQEFKGTRAEIREQAVQYALSFPCQYIVDP